MDVRARLFMVSVAVVLVGGLTMGVYLEASMRAGLESRIHDQLLAAARSTREMLREPKIDPDDVADRMGAAHDTRISVIDRAGRVLGDSVFDDARLDALPDHSTRPEIAQAFAGEEGRAERRSTSVGERMVYLAVPVGAPPRLVVRASLPEQRIAAAIHQLRVVIAVALLLGMLVALGMSVFASRTLSRHLRATLRKARAVAGDGVGGPEHTLAEIGSGLEAVVETLAAERDRSAAVLSSMEESVIALDSRRVITLVNRASKTLFHPNLNPIGQPLLDAVHLTELHDALADALGSDDDSFEIELGGGGRRRQSLLARVTPQEATDGTVVVLHDVTRLRHLERMRRDFVANVSHELRTPVSVIRANAETLLDGALDDTKSARLFVEAMLRNAVRLSTLIADLLHIARIEAGKYPLNPTRIFVAEAGRVAMQSVQELADENGTEIVVNIPEDLTIHADTSALQHVLVNLLENAIKYTQEGSYVELAAIDGENYVRVSVGDNGPGIVYKHRKRVFERFYRVDPGRSKASGGTGLGLAIVKHLVGAQRGHVGVEANEPQGSLFWFELPKGEGRGTPAPSAPFEV